MEQLAIPKEKVGIALDRAHRIFQSFERMFPEMAKSVRTYGLRQIRSNHTIFLKTKDGNTMYFTYDDAKHWTLETLYPPK